MARRGYSPEFRRRVVDLVEAGGKFAAVATDFGISEQPVCIVVGDGQQFGLCRATRGTFRKWSKPA
ncbi:hypothetical protein [Candidatus Poriferisodalis sp.]|uniref:hypothetical protein n=1 Tax=Candidatus Poriferisodalis sp. TaxID=3101277 RepID=UPI003B52932E